MPFGGDAFLSTRHADVVKTFTVKSTNELVPRVVEVTNELVDTGEKYFYEGIIV